MYTRPCTRAHIYPGGLWEVSQVDRSLTRRSWQVTSGSGRGRESAVRRVFSTRGPPLKKGEGNPAGGSQRSPSLPDPGGPRGRGGKLSGPRQTPSHAEVIPDPRESPRQPPPPPRLPRVPGPRLPLARAWTVETLQLLEDLLTRGRWNPGDRQTARYRETPLFQRLQTLRTLNSRESCRL